jgi:hypothetical protein
MIERRPETGDRVHYVSYGTPGGEYSRECRAAVVTTPGQWVTVETVQRRDRKQRTLLQNWEPDAAALYVMNPTGIFLNETVMHDPGHEVLHPEDIPEDRLPLLCTGLDHSGGTWHWPHSE